MKTKYLTSPLFLICLLMTLIVNVHGQNREDNQFGKLLITGFVYDRDTKEPLPNAFFSINGKSGYTTNELGRFLMKGNPGDTISYSYVGYSKVNVQVPDTLAALEYLLGIFLTKDTIMIPEVVIFPRLNSVSSIITPVRVDQEMLNNAQANVDKATVQGLTQPVKSYDADMNAKQTMRVYQMRAQYKGLLVTPENSVSVSNQNFHSYNLLYGSPIVPTQKGADRIITQSESEMLLGQYLAGKKIYLDNNGKEVIPPDEDFNAPK